MRGLLHSHGARARAGAREQVAKSLVGDCADARRHLSAVGVHVAVNRRACADSGGCRGTIRCPFTHHGTRTHRWSHCPRRVHHFVWQVPRQACERGAAQLSRVGRAREGVRKQTPVDRCARVSQPAAAGRHVDNVDSVVTSTEATLCTNAASEAGHGETAAGSLCAI